MPLFNTQMRPKRFQVSDGSVGVVVSKFRVGGRLATAALVKLHDVEHGRIEVLAVGGLGTTSGSTVDDDHGNTIWTAALFPRNRVKVRDLEHALRMGFNGRIKHVCQRRRGVKHGRTSTNTCIFLSP